MNCFHRQWNGTCSLSETIAGETNCFDGDEYNPSYDEDFRVDSECICFKESDECPSFEEDK